jgi:hypothetical protein
MCLSGDIPIVLMALRHVPRPLLRTTSIRDATWTRGRLYTVLLNCSLEKTTLYYSSRLRLLRDSLTSDDGTSTYISPSCSIAIPRTNLVHFASQDESQTKMLAGWRQSWPSTSRQCSHSYWQNLAADATASFGHGPKIACCHVKSCPAKRGWWWKPSSHRSDIQDESLQRDHVFKLAHTSR